MIHTSTIDWFRHLATQGIPANYQSYAPIFATADEINKFRLAKPQRVNAFLNYLDTIDPLTATWQDVLAKVRSL